MHLRRWPHPGVPGKVGQWVWMTDKDERAARRLLPHMAFDEDEIVSCIIGGKARTWADSRL